jgi:hypothetical protein
MKKNFLIKFSKRKVDYREAVDAFFMSKGIACICCSVSDISDVINPYCVPGYETLNDALVSYIDSVVQNIPIGVPVAIELCGGSFSDAEKEIIRDAVWNHYEMELGKAQKARLYNIIRICWFALFFILSLLLVLSDKTGDISRELIYVVFYFFGDRMIDYIVFDSNTFERDRIRYAQLVTMKVIFRDRFIDEELNDEEVDEILKDITLNARSTAI